jgi:hypothetical protein
MDSDHAIHDINVVDSLLESGRGDQGRLEFIRRCMADGRTLHESDRRYIMALTAKDTTVAKIPAADGAPPPEVGEIEMVRGLVRRGLGDQGRLGYMLRILEGGGRLRASDAEYLRAKYDMCRDAPEPAQAAVPDPGAAAGRRPETPDLRAGPELLQVEEELDAVRSELDAASEYAEAISRRRKELDAVRSELEKTRRLAEEDAREMKDMYDYKDRLAGQVGAHQKLLQEISGELQSVRDLVREQNSSIDEQARALDAIRSERMQLEEDSRRLGGVAAELAEERKKLAAARKENRALKEKGRSLAKSQKDTEKVNRDIQKEREKVAKKIGEEKAKLEEQETLRKSLESETAELEDLRIQRNKSKRGTKLAEKVLQESRGRASG